MRPATINPERKSDTPETDAELLSSDCTYNCAHCFSLIRDEVWENGKCVKSGEDIAHGNDSIVVLADFARQLERKRNEARAQAEAWRDFAIRGLNRNVLPSEILPWEPK